MNRQLLAVLILVVVAAGLAMAFPANVPPAARVQGPVFLTGLEDVPSSGEVPPEHPVPTPLDDWTPGSIVDTAGWTYYDIQTNSTNGKQIGVDAEGFVHIAFTTGTNVGSTQRHIYYNVWDPNTQDFTIPGGSQVDGSTRAGFCNLVVHPAGWAYPIFHQTTTGTHTAAGIDFLPRQGAFTTSQVPLLNNWDIIWPHESIDAEGNLQTVSTNNGGATGTHLYYAKGHPVFEPNGQDSLGLNIEWPIGFTDLGTQTFVTSDIAASFHSQKVAVAWLNNPDGIRQRQNDVYLKISEDGGATWGDTINVTHFAVVDTNCCTNIGDPNVCNGDTLQPWLEVSAFIDNNDVVHLAFSVSAFYYFDANCTASPAGLIYSMIFHWDEQHNEFNKIGDGFFIPADSTFIGLGVNNLMIQRPSLAQDTANGNLYCSFQRFDSLVINSCGYPPADAYVTVSTDGGRYWAVPTNVTNTAMVQGNDRSERDITIAPIVNGFVHMEYQVDHVAGSFSSTAPECTESHNEIDYQRIPVADIATTPILPPYPLHADSTGFPPLNDESARNLPGPLPKEFALYQNYPNPFNPTTNIQFDLAVTGNVTLRVFDITGREVATLLNKEYTSAGAHVVEFDASKLASGVYFYRLDALGHQLTRKMMLVK